MNGDPLLSDPLLRPPAVLNERERWKLAREIFDAALEMEEADRDRFVRLECGNDTELQREVDTLLAADAEAGSYLESPLPNSGLSGAVACPLVPGDVLCDRFELVRLLGEGGMGYVFQAFDRELQVRIALKVIRPEIAGVPGALARFRQEVRLARTITHPNICRTFDLDREVRHPVGDAQSSTDGRRVEITFFTMEFLPGETLAARIKRDGALPLSEATMLAEQMALALGAAHSLGVVHRDMKPANVMLVAATEHEGLRAVITDFGLARASANLLESVGAATLSHSGQVLGTLAYMAPEQLEGGAVSVATDIYGLGLVLFEMVTGIRVFPSENLLSGLAQRLAGAAPAIRTQLSTLPPVWSYLILRCLQPNAEDRFASASEITAALGGRGGRALAARNFRPRLLDGRRNLKIASLAIVAALSLLAGGLRLYQQRATPPLDARTFPGALLYLAPVLNQTGEVRLDCVAPLLETAIAQSAQIQLLDKGKAGDILEHMNKAMDAPIDRPLGREIAMRAGAARAVFPTVTGGHGEYTLTLEVEQPGDSPRLSRRSAAKSFKWHSAAGSSATGSTIEASIAPELVSAVRDASEWVRSQAGESAGDIARLDAAPDDLTTSDWQALADYNQAEALLLQNRKEEAIDLLKDAVKRDAGFATAYAELADTLESVGRSTEAHDFYLKALSDSDAQRLSRKERDFIKGQFALDTADYESALAAYRDASAFYERDFRSWFNQAYPLEKLDRPTDAIAALRRADALSPTHSAQKEMVYPLLMMGDLEGAKAAAEGAASNGHSEQGWMTGGVVAFCEGEYDRADLLFKKLSQSANHDQAQFGDQMEVRLLAERGRYAEALQWNLKSAERRSGSAPAMLKAEPMLDRGSLEFDLGDFAAGLVEIDRALHTSQELNTLQMAGMVLGKAMPRMHGAERARAMQQLTALERSSQLEGTEIAKEVARDRIHAQVLLGRGDAAGAVAASRLADRLDAPFGPRDELARALVARAATERDSARKTALLEEALSNYGRTALRPITVWLDVNFQPPGSVGEQMAAYIRLSRALRKNDAQGQAVVASMMKLRGSLPN